MVVLTATPSAVAMCYGIGDQYWWHISGDSYKTTPQLLSWLDFPANNRLLGIWLTDKWKPSWIHGLQSAMDSGYIPVLIDYTLGDIYQHSHPWHYVKQHRLSFINNIKKIAKTVHPLNGTILIVLQPEFNVPGLQNKPQFGGLLKKAADLLHHSCHPGLHILVGTCVGDFGHYRNRIKDVNEWKKFAPVLNKAVPSLNFLAFQEMRGGTHNNREGLMKSYTPNAEGISVLEKRTVAFSAYLKNHYHKPLLLAYFVVSTLSPPGEVPGKWERDAAHSYKKLLDDSRILSRNGVFGIMAMSLFNDMAHNNNRRDFWGNSADHFGLVRANTALGQDNIGEPPYQVKEAGKVWIDGTKNLPTSSCLPSSLDQYFFPKRAS